MRLSHTREIRARFIFLRVAVSRTPNTPVRACQRVFTIRRRARARAVSIDAHGRRRRARHKSQRRGRVRLSDECPPSGVGAAFTCSLFDARRRAVCADSSLATSPLLPLVDASAISRTPCRFRACVDTIDAA